MTGLLPRDPDCEHAQITIEYPTTITVRVRDGQLWAVNVEEISTAPRQAYCVACSATEGPAIDAAVALADAAEWPDWEFGF